MAGELITITGAQEVMRMLEAAPKALVARSFLKALDAAGQVVVSELWPRVPIDIKAAMNKAHGGSHTPKRSKTASSVQGPLVGKLDAFITLDSQFRGGVVEIGFGGLGHIANWVEYGHRIMGRKPQGGKRKKGVRREGEYLGDVPAHPFMRPAAMASADRAIEAFGEVIAATLKEGIS
jgi:hypothetical protein